MVKSHLLCLAELHALSGGSGGSRTRNPWVKSPLLYLIELRTRVHGSVRFFSPFLLMSNLVTISSGHHACVRIGSPSLSSSTVVLNPSLLQNLPTHFAFSLIFMVGVDGVEPPQPV
jgi:hypothetical protein